MDRINVADLSRWQGNIDWDEFRKHVDAVVIKATGSDGGLYTDGKFIRNRDEARRVGLPIWFYHYKGSGTAKEQAQYMLNAIGGLRPGEAIVCDDENEAKVNPGFLAEFTDAIKELTDGLINVVYSNLSRFQGVDVSGLKGRNVAAWVAKYGMNTGTIEGAGTPPTLDTISIVMWQYTSAARISGVSENSVDMNIFYGTVEQFKAYGAKGNVPAPSAPQPAPDVVATGDGTYTVVKNDTLSGIGSKLGIDWRVIANTNGIVSPYVIYPGQKLKVYGGTPGQAAQVNEKRYTVVSNDTLIGIGAKTGVNWAEIARINNIAAPYVIYPGQVLQLGDGGMPEQAAAQRTYTVVSNDNLSVIGEKTGVAWPEIARLNGIAPPYTIYPNQVLKLN